MRHANNMYYLGQVGNLRPSNFGSNPDASWQGTHKNNEQNKQTNRGSRKGKLRRLYYLSTWSRAHTMPCASSAKQRQAISARESMQGHKEPRLHCCGGSSTLYPISEER